MKKMIGLAVVIVLAVVIPARAQKAPPGFVPDPQPKPPTTMCDKKDAMRSVTPGCRMPLLSAFQAASGFVVANGRWDPFDTAMSPKDSDVEISCIRARVSQLSNSTIGFCLIAMGFVLDQFPGAGVAVNTRYLDIVSWGEDRIIAEHHGDCENQQLVIDFPSNSVTLTSILSFGSKDCAEFNKGETPTMVFSLVYHNGLHADKGSNPFMD